MKCSVMALCLTLTAACGQDLETDPTTSCPDDATGEFHATVEGVRLNTCTARAVRGGFGPTISAEYWLIEAEWRNAADEFEQSMVFILGDPLRDYYDGENLGTHIKAIPGGDPARDRTGAMAIDGELHVVDIDNGYVTGTFWFEGETEEGEIRLVEDGVFSIKKAN